MEEIKKDVITEEVTITMQADEVTRVVSKKTYPADEMVNNAKKFESLVRLCKDVEYSRITGDDNSYSQSRTVIDMAYLIEDSLHETPEEFEKAMVQLKKDVLSDAESSYEGSMPRELPTMHETEGARS